jgi:hypothetical protein
MYFKIILVLLLTITLQAKGGKSFKGKVVSAGIKIISTASRSLINKRAKSSARKMISLKIPKKQSGLYKFKASNGKSYIGKSIDINRRLKEHISSGKLHPKDLKTIKTAKVAKQDITKVERKEILNADKISKGNLANKQLAPRSVTRSKLNLLKAKF